MPTYTFRCSNDHTFDRTLRPQEREGQTCPECGEPAEQIVSGQPGMVLRGDAWLGKNIRVRGQMRQKDKGAAGRQRDRKKAGTGVRLVPNVGGERVDSWDEAGRLAKSKGLDTSSYKAKSRGEKT